MNRRDWEGGETWYAKVKDYQIVKEAVNCAEYGCSARFVVETTHLAYPRGPFYCPQHGWCYARTG